MFYLYLHPESDCLFWSDTKTEGDGLLEEIGESETNTKTEAFRLYALACPSSKPEDVTTSFHILYKDKHYD